MARTLYFSGYSSSYICIHLYLYLQLRSSQPAVRGVHVEGGQFVARDWSNLAPTSPFSIPRLNFYFKNTFTIRPSPLLHHFDLPTTKPSISAVIGHLPSKKICPDHVSWKLLVGICLGYDVVLIDFNFYMSYKTKPISTLTLFDWNISRPFQWSLSN